MLSINLIGKPLKSLIQFCSTISLIFHHGIFTNFVRSPRHFHEFRLARQTNFVWPNGFRSVRDLPGASWIFQQLHSLLGCCKSGSELIGVTEVSFYTNIGTLLNVFPAVRTSFASKSLETLSVTNNSVGLRTAAACHVDQNSSSYVVHSGRLRTDADICNWKVSKTAELATKNRQLWSVATVLLL